MSEGELAVEVLGLTVNLRATGPAAETFGARLDRLWGRCLAPTPGTLDLEVEVDREPGEGPEAELDFAVALEAVTRQVTVMGVEYRAGELLMLHACALADPATGRSVLLVGPSGMGKSTLARTLGTSFGYVSDETAAVAEDGTLLAYPKPLSLRVVDGVKHQFSPDELGLEHADGDLSVAGVVLLDRRPESEEVVAETLENVEAIALLAPHTSYLGRLEAPLHRLAALCDQVDGVGRVTYRDAEDLEPYVRNVLAGGGTSQ